MQLSTHINLSIASEMLEKHVSFHLYQIMTSYNLRLQKQSVIRTIIHVRLHFPLDTWLSALNKECQLGLLLIDLCKAFDLVDHDFLSKNKMYKCNSSSLQWFKYYLNNREQLVEINGTKSTHYYN